MKGVTYATIHMSNPEPLRVEGRDIDGHPSVSIGTEDRSGYITLTFDDPAALREFMHSLDLAAQKAERDAIRYREQACDACEQRECKTHGNEGVRS